MMTRKKVLMISAAFILFAAIPAAGLSAREVFPVSPFRITMVSSAGPLAAWRCGAWSGVTWSPDYFSAEWPPWNGSGLGLQSLSFVPHLWWTGGEYYFYRGYVPFAWKYWKPLRRNERLQHGASKAVAKQNGHRRRDGASSKTVKGLRRSPQNSASPIRVPRSRPHVRPRPVVTGQPVMRPQRPYSPPRGRGRY